MLLIIFLFLLGHVSGCSPGEFVNSADNCQACPANTWQNRPSETYCYICKPGHIFVNKTSECQKCETGKWTRTDYKIFYNKNKIQVPTTKQASALQAHTCEATSGGYENDGTLAIRTTQIQNGVANSILNFGRKKANNMQLSHQNFENNIFLTTIQKGITKFALHFAEIMDSYFELPTNDDELHELIMEVPKFTGRNIVEVLANSDILRSIVMEQLSEEFALTNSIVEKFLPEATTQNINKDAAWSAFASTNVGDPALKTFKTYADTQELTITSTAETYLESKTVKQVQKYVLAVAEMYYSPAKRISTKKRILHGFPGVSFIGANLNNATFAGSTLRAADFRLADLTKADFENADLTNARFENVDLTDATLTGAILQGATCDDDTILPSNYFCELEATYSRIISPDNLENLNFFLKAPSVQLDLSQSTFKNTCIQGNFNNTTRPLLPTTHKLCQRGTHSHIIGPGVSRNCPMDLSNCDLTGLQFENLEQGYHLPPGYRNIDGVVIGPGAVVSDRTFKDEDLSSIDFRGVVFTNVKLSNVDITDAIFENLLLTNVTTDGLYKRSTSVGRRLSATTFGVASGFIKNGHLYSKGAVISDDLVAVNLGTTIEGVTFSGITVKDGTHFRNGNLKDVTFQNCDLQLVDMKGCQFNNVVFENTIVTTVKDGQPDTSDFKNWTYDGQLYLLGPGIDLSGKQFENIEWENINFTGANFKNARITGATLDSLVVTDADFSNVHFDAITSENIQGVPKYDSTTFMVKNGRFEKICGVGTFNNSNVCEPCARGKYQDEQDKRECKICNAGSKTNRVDGADLCSQCDPGKFSMNKSSHCFTHLRANHTDCRYNCKIKVGETGWWNDENDSNNKVETKLTIKLELYAEDFYIKKTRDEIDELEAESDAQVIHEIVRIGKVGDDECGYMVFQTVDEVLEFSVKCSEYKNYHTHGPIRLFHLRDHMKNHGNSRIELMYDKSTSRLNITVSSFIGASTFNPMNIVNREIDTPIIMQSGTVEIFSDTTSMFKEQDTELEIIWNQADIEPDIEEYELPIPEVADVADSICNHVKNPSWNECWLNSDCDDKYYKYTSVQCLWNWDPETNGDWCKCVPKKCWHNIDCENGYCNNNKCRKYEYMPSNIQNTFQFFDYATSLSRDNCHKIKKIYDIAVSNVNQKTCSHIDAKNTKVKQLRTLFRNNCILKINS